jgi:hypothetical protein
LPQSRKRQFQKVSFGRFCLSLENEIGLDPEAGHDPFKENPEQATNSYIEYRHAVYAPPIEARFSHYGKKIVFIKNIKGKKYENQEGDAPGKAAHCRDSFV